MTAEKAFAGTGRAKVWTYLIIGIVILLGAIVFNLAFNDPDTAKHGVKSFLGLPGWALALVTFAIGAFLYWIGLKMETDWPEFVGAFLISGSIVALELILGWDTFAPGGLFVLPYVLPLAVFFVLVIIGMKKSV